jgi:mRNA interferase MazF
VNFGKPRGKEQAYERPAIILQNNDLAGLQTVIVIPTTGKLSRGQERGTVRLGAGEGGLWQDSVVLGHQITVVDKAKLVRQLGKLSPHALADVEAVVAYALALPT